MDFKDNLRYFRKLKGFSREILARKLNLSSSVISAYENGQRKPSYEVLENLSEILEISTDELMGREKKTAFDFSEGVLDFIQKLTDNKELIDIINQIPTSEKCKTCITVQFLCSLVMKYSGSERQTI